MDKLRIAYRYLAHLLTARHSKGHGIHSPYLYRFTQNVLYEQHPFYIFPRIEALRQQLLRDTRIVHLKDYGAGHDRTTRVMDIARKSLKSRKQAQILFRIVHFLQATHVLELGTSLGITTAYLASGYSRAKCVSLEGSEAVVAVARDQFKQLELSHIEAIVGNIDDTLPALIARNEPLDVVFFDANHRKEPTLRYFEQCAARAHSRSVFVFDDIYWSAEMTEAWQTICRHRAVTASLDLFDMGIVFFNNDFPKKTFKMKL